MHCTYLHWNASRPLWSSSTLLDQTFFRLLIKMPKHSAKISTAILSKGLGLFLILYTHFVLFCFWIFCYCFSTSSRKKPLFVLPVEFGESISFDWQTCMFKLLEEKCPAAAMQTLLLLCVTLAHCYETRKSNLITKYLHHKNEENQQKTNFVK